MLYESTRDCRIAIPSSEVMMQGISPDGGLFVPKEFPAFTLERIERMANMTYQQRAVEILSPFLSDFTEEEIRECVDSAYNDAHFDTKDIAPVRRLTEREYILELWHGPTFAFKDMALQLLPRLMIKAQEKTGEKKDVLILVATSGDTGKAALEGFKDVKGTHLVVFYPEEGVSHAQKLQMLTQEGENLHVVGIAGNFDDAQNGVKHLFTDRSYSSMLREMGYQLSSANSINWGRLMPQIVYYFSAYADMLRSGDIKPGEKINIVVPTGNFGNILAGFYAKIMGVPIRKLICASNTNNVLSDFFHNGEYDSRRQFFKTISPSMDILISSNLERLLYEISGRDDQMVEEWMISLKREGWYKIGLDLHKKLRELIWAGYANDEQTMDAIQRIYNRYNYVLDPHTAVAQKVYEDYIGVTQDVTKTIVAATASPFKFSRSVVLAILGRDSVEGKDEFTLSDILSRISGNPIPEGLKILKSKPILHSTKCRREDMGDVVLGMLKRQ